MDNLSQDEAEHAIKRLSNKMQLSAQNMDFEKAAEYREEAKSLRDQAKLLNARESSRSIVEAEEQENEHRPYREQLNHAIFGAPGSPGIRYQGRQQRCPR